VVEPRSPSGLFPSGPPRPAYREPNPVRPAAVVAGSGVGGAWVLLIGLLGTSLPAYAWLSIIAAVSAWLGAAALARAGDRGAAAGVAVSAGLGLAVTAGIVVQQWATVGWPLW
jgi:hypothetical protein